MLLDLYVSIFMILCSRAFLCKCASDQVVISISSGLIRGYRAVSTGSHPYFGFRAIPFAKPPIGKRRFKPPEPVGKWNGTFDATKFGDECPQFEELTRGVIGNEDCLTLNVYTPKLSTSESLPVMVWIHGGAFIIGTGHHFHYGPQNWMDHPVVLVTINYRLGALGFLNTLDDSAFGNYGMLDQVLALKWVRNNAVHFGGDPERVTIFGESAGAASVIYHILSPLSTGLFQRAVAQSGTAMSYWAFQRNPLTWARKLAEQVNCPTGNTSQMVDCFRETSAFDLVRESRRFQVTFLIPIIWSPSVEHAGSPGFLTEDPVRMLEEGRITNKVPVIIGMTKSEGHFFYTDLSLAFPSVYGRDYFVHSIPSNLPLFSFVQPDMSNAIREIAQNYYSSANLNDLETFDSVFSEVMGDAMFAATISKTAEIFSKSGMPTYTYLLNYYGKHCLAEYLGRLCDHSTHADELFLQFRFSYAQIDRVPDDDARMTLILNSLWVSFAYEKTLLLNQGDVWPTYNVNRSYAELNLNSTVRNGLLSDKMDLWTKTLPQLADFKFVDVC